MAGRTIAIGDIHGETAHLFKLLGTLPTLDGEDTLVFLGDYLDRGPESAQVVEFLMKLPSQTPAKVVTLRGNHEDAWLRVIDDGWDGFVSPPGNGCLAAMRSYTGGPVPAEGELPLPDEVAALRRGLFFPEDVVGWLRALPFWYEDQHAIYVHAGLPPGPGGFAHPRDVEPQVALLWCRNEQFFRNYRGKTVVFGHTRTEFLPIELSGYTPDDPADLWAYENVVGIDTGCGNEGFLTALEFPALNVYESRD
jgi:serine/threonine protein phosphatase 1